MKPFIPYINEEVILMKRYIRDSVTEILAVDASYEFVELPQFARQAKKLGLDQDDIEELKQSLIKEKPEANLGSNVYKFRWVPSKWNTGQSGGTRVIYVDVIKDSKAYLVSIYAKNVKANLDPKEQEVIRKLGKLLSKGGKF